MNEQHAETTAGAAPRKREPDHDPLSPDQRTAWDEVNAAEDALNKAVFNAAVSGVQVQVTVRERTGGVVTRGPPAVCVTGTVSAQRPNPDPEWT